MTYILDDDDRATVGRRPVTVTVTGRDGAGRPMPEGSVLLAARAGDVPAQGALRPRPSMMVLPRIEERTVVRVLPGQGRDVFDEGTILNLTLRTDRTRDADEDVVVIRDVEVSGLGFRDLLSVEVADHARLTVTALNAVADKPLGRLSAAARAAARHRLGVERTDEPTDLLVAVDMSASMAPAFADGTVAAVVDIVVGLAQVTGFGRDLQVWLLGEQAVRVPAPDEPTELATATMSAIAATGLGCGFRSAPAGIPDGREQVVFVVTDAVPPDAGELRAARLRGQDRRLVVVDRGLPSRAAADLPTTVLEPPPAGVDAAKHLLDTPELLTATVAAMLAGTGGSR